MKISTTLLLSASLFCFLGCTEDKKETSTETATAENISTPATESPAAPVNAEITDLNGESPRATMEIAETPTAAAPAPTTAAGLNPPHGQPGHDCAIAVGAPLNSKGNAGAVNATATPKPVSPVGAPTLTVPPVSNTAPGLNPPHGQPGHDCAIAVGAPLKK